MLKDGASWGIKPLPLASRYGQPGAQGTGVWGAGRALSVPEGEGGGQGFGLAEGEAECRAEALSLLTLL